MTDTIAHPTEINKTIETFSKESLTILTERNRPLAATLYRPQAKLKAAVMIAPATGIKQQFYHSFASYLAEQGFGVLTFDNEGIGDSLTCPLAKCDASLISWGRHDLPAVLQTLQDEFPDTSYHLIGHSAGGQLIGLMPNHDALTSVFNVACSSGRIKNMTMPYRAKAMFFMDAFIPVGNLALGYTPSDKMGMGEPLPRGVAAQWREWCNGAGYIKTAFGKTIHTQYYDEVTTPALWLYFSDDDIANDKNVADMLRVFPNMAAEKRRVEPAEFGLDEIGHMKYFSRKLAAKAPALWEMATTWLTQHSD